MRIASLSPAATEILRLLDPPGAEILPPSQIDVAHQPPALNAHALARLHPNIVLSDDPALSPAFIPDAKVLIFNPSTPEDLLDAILRMGHILRAEPAAERLMLSLRERLWRAQEHVNPYVNDPAVIVLEDLHPLTVAGDPAAHLAERAGGRHVLHPSIAPSAHGSASGLQAGQRRAGPSRTIVRADLARGEIIVLALRRRTIEDMRSLWAAANLREHAPRARVVLLESEGALHRPGLRMIDALEFFIALVQDRPALMTSRLRWEQID